jgi:hypothetical protein
MPDTVYYNSDGVAVPYDSLPADVRELYEQYKIPNETAYTKTEEGGKGYAVIVWIFFITIGFFAVRRAWKSKGVTFLRSWNDPLPSGYDPEIHDQYYDQYKKSQTEEVLKDYNVYYGRDLVFPDEQYEKLFYKHSAYYRRLSPELQQIFLKRTKQFIKEKTFLIKSKEPFIEMPMLISAAAIQLTFGLDKYLLPHYEYIRIYPEEYFAKDSLKVLAGHVYGNTITLAWNQFLQGYEEYADGVNVGLHEMSHALYFQLVEAQTGRCAEFANNFNKVMEEGEEVYQLKQSQPSETVH